MIVKIICGGVVMNTFAVDENDYSESNTKGSIILVKVSKSKMRKVFGNCITIIKA